ncbi:MAG: SusD/RagB family nutrient-binding outer membrane lipoprotein, partial [Saprospiraceae bacterium]|nr:SusD/RagB family nutrient-binding outer membrane lipoprotein [Saprospiraceae bacterium]
GGLGGADEKYRLAIQLSMDYFDSKPGEIDPVLKMDYINSLPLLTSLSESDAVTAIQMQIYIADFMRMPEGWIQWRRTKVPTLVPPQGSQLSDIIRRFSYPPDEKGANPNAPGDKTLDTPMWYEN